MRYHILRRVVTLVAMVLSLYSFPPIAVANSEFPVPTGGAGNIIRGRNSDLWFTEFSSGKIGRITTSGVITEFPLAAGSNPSGIAMGADERVWFTENGNGKIGYVSTSDTVVEFSLSSGNQPRDITLGPDNNMWFTESANGGQSGLIGTISTTTTKITEFPLPSGIVANGIVAGPDGNFWFTESFPDGAGRGIGRMSLTGSAQEFFLNDMLSHPGSIIVGPDGALWFSSDSSDDCPPVDNCGSIKRITTSGTIDQLLFTNGSPASLTVGPDGKVWFAGGPTGLGSLTTTGSFVSYSVHNAPPPPFVLQTEGITTGPDGNIWYTGGCSSGLGDCVSLVDVALGNLTLTPAQVNEGSSTSLTGVFTDLTSSTIHDVVVSWGDNTQNSRASFSGQTGTFNFGSIPHTYLNNTVGTFSSNFPVAVTVTNDKGSTAAGTLQETVANVPPRFSNVPLNLPVTAGGVATLSGNVTDPGVQDTETLTINWGDGSPVQTVNLAVGSSSFSVTHQYTANGTFQIVARVTDDDGATDAATTSATIGNFRPPGVTLSTSKLDFGAQQVGTSSLGKTVMLTNSGAGPLAISKVTITGEYSQTNNCPAQVIPASNCSFQVSFTPQGSGTRSGVLSITDNASNSPNTVALTGMGQDFSLAPSSPTAATATVTPPQTATYSVTVAPVGGFNQTVALACSGAPAQSTCAVSPSSILLNGTSAATATVTVTTTAPSHGFLLPFGTDAPRMTYRLAPLLLGLLGMVMVLSLFMWRREQRLRWVPAFTLAVLLCVGMTMSSCGGGGSQGRSGGGAGNPGTQAGTYTLSVSGSFTSGSTTVTRSTQLRLVVQ